MGDEAGEERPGEQSWKESGKCRHDLPCGGLTSALSGPRQAMQIARH
jgi:hypothetical protein